MAEVSSGAGPEDAVARFVPDGTSPTDVADAGANDPAKARETAKAALSVTPENARRELLCFADRQRKDLLSEQSPFLRCADLPPTYLPNTKTPIFVDLGEKQILKLC
ncbi:hypothetical protein [Glutamicibacter arilaitensis]|uniref:hypothetical protein n=1 Tax=Glutamicibacter arilaitensis TaxID=256701 RepID=UPI00384DF328